ncbi:MAG TPA: LLM class flavin-dependent oxidoreductase [Actinomycetota bacterium]
MRIGVKPGQWGWSFAELEAAWAVAEEAGFDVLACFDHVTDSPGGRSAWDGPSLLSAMAGPTRSISLAIQVVNASLRNPLLFAGQVAVAQAASGGRVEVGLGAGSFHLARYDNAAIGVPFTSLAERMDRLEACCRTLPGLWRGERVTDPMLGLRDASLGPLDIDPPKLWVGGASDRALEIAARFADGWHGSGGEEERFAELCGRLDELADRAGRPIDKSMQLWATELEGLRGRAERLRDAGASTVILVLDAESRGPDAVRRLADAVL